MTEADATPPLMLRGEGLVLRHGKPGDETALEALFRCPGVRRWWGSESNHDIDELVANDDPEKTVLLIERNGSVIGLIQYHEEEDPMYRHAGIDVALHDDQQGNGYGPAAIRLVVDHLVKLGHHRIVIDPNASNVSAIKAYERVGFAPVGVMREYEWSEHLQRWTDGLLMELLIADLSEAEQERSTASDRPL